LEKFGSHLSAKAFLALVGLAAAEEIEGEVSHPLPAGVAQQRLKEGADSPLSSLQRKRDQKRS
jgi:hypothetical protein